MYYEEDEKIAPPEEHHTHTYHVITHNVTVRYCETCGLSWVLDGSYGWHWVKVREPEEEQEA